MESERELKQTPTVVFRYTELGRIEFSCWRGSRLQSSWWRRIEDTLVRGSENVSHSKNVVRKKNITRRDPVHIEFALKNGDALLYNVSTVVLEIKNHEKYRYSLFVCSHQWFNLRRSRSSISDPDSNSVKCWIGGGVSPETAMANYK